ncbi:hypothetical protein AXY43_16535 [Clostridium sp. MF28]|uniref:hypothetical protein n=1 Tax=Clostridium TaxID=1485 RepID=UPI000CF9719C|nr:MULTISPECIES: hypothetical protein [Clostridium]AVK49458.1 hypothetical protein AXY43_16535 [Clostridium sp. MF28]PSM55398.1 hypothetical protein C4L39_23130 [Clostridium diolis]
MDNKEYLKWIMPSIKNRTVSNDNLNGKLNFRIEKAKEQYQLPVVKRDDIIKYVKDFLYSMDMEIAFDPAIKPKKREKRRIDYSKINKESKEDIVWIKFTTENYISVIGTGCDIYFSDYAKNNTTAGLINQSLGLEWDDSEVLIFPLKNIKDGLYRSDIESGIGNYLISKGVPILDFYSHNY